MSSIAARTYLTPQEYLAFERKATTKHEYLAGVRPCLSRSGLRRTLSSRRCLLATDGISGTGKYNATFVN